MHNGSRLFTTTATLCLGLALLMGIVPPIRAGDMALVRESRRGALATEEIQALGVQEEQATELLRITSGDSADDVLAGALCLLGLLALIGWLVSPDEEETS